MELIGAGENLDSNEQEMDESWYCTILSLYYKLEEIILFPRAFVFPGLSIFGLFSLAVDMQQPKYLTTPQIDTVSL